jgi:lysozyme family protein
MANYKNIVPHIKRAEGGISSIPQDSASKNPSPCGNKNGYPIHTNKGIIWATFKGLASKGGYDATCDNFLKMPDSIWLKVYKVGFWDEVQGDRIKNQAIANTFVEMVWGSGLGSVSRGTGTLGWLNKFFKKNYNKNLTTISQMVDFVNKLDSQGKTPELFEKLNDFRANKYRALNQPTFLKGWLNRLNSFYVLNKPYAISTKEKNSAFALVVGIGLIALGGAYIYVRTKRK